MADAKPAAACLRRGSGAGRGRAQPLVHEEHGPEKLATPEYVGLRRFRAADGSARFLVIYELSGPDVAAAPIAPSAQSSRRMEERS